ncbi:hypothetical protein D9757_006154 [Collybiopsis confluens]|uniref:C2 domain-containing protein n=1 Tax=Collybiopsis confluens TaxID=2823264 RepID=A0A8H5HHR8_9AGAR|nr:hypothetical protein D9757_006154 [Collybiopsis confluens]
MVQILDLDTTTTNLQFDSTESQASRRVQFHVIGTQNFLSPKARGKRPSNAFVGMRVAGDSPKDKLHLATSAVRCKTDSEPEWYDNLGPIWLSPSGTVSFQVNTRSRFSKTTSVLSSTEPYTLKDLRKMQGSLDRQSTIALPLHSKNEVSNESVLIINIRELSTSKSGMEEYMSLKSAGSTRNSLEDESPYPVSPLSPDIPEFNYD